MSTINESEAAVISDIERTAERFAAARQAVARSIFGQDEVVDLTLTTILCGGHALLVGVPGLAKTRLVATLGTILGLDAKRIQFTPDLMPSDIVGSEVLEESESGSAQLPVRARARCSPSC